MFERKSGLNEKNVPGGGLSLIALFRISRSCSKVVFILLAKLEKNASFLK
jgi:hypothetical protein